jgi:hypothetical protein
MNGSKEELKQFINKFRQQFDNMSFEEVAFPRGVKGMAEYRDAATIYRKSTPIHTKGALLFNMMLKKHRVYHIPPIRDGDKIKFTYLKMPNPVHDIVIATPDELPKEFGLDKYIDREKQFNKSFLDPIKSITDVIGWELEEKSTLEEFFG